MKKTISILILVFVLLTVSVSAAIIDFDPDYWLDLDTTSNYTDKTGNYTTSAIGTGPDCSSGDVCYFDGTEGVDGLTIMGAAGYDDDIVMFCWINLTTSQGGKTFGGDNAAGSPKQNGYFLTGPDRFSMYVDLTGGLFFNDHNINLNTWYLSVWKYSGGTLTTWLDNTSTINAAPSGTLVSYSEPNTIGDNDNNNYGTIGYYQRCALYRDAAAFGQDEVNELFTGGRLKDYNSWYNLQPPSGDIILQVKANSTLTNSSIPDFTATLLLNENNSVEVQQSLNGTAYFNNVSTGIIEVNVTKNNHINSTNNIYYLGGIIKPDQIDNNMLALFHLNNYHRYQDTTANPYDYTGNNNYAESGAVQGGGYYQDGGAVMDGVSNNYIDTVINEVPNNGTIGLWFYMNQLGSIQTLFSSIGDAGGTSEDLVLRYNNDNNLRLLMDTTGSTCLADTTQNNIEASVWYHVMVTWDSTDCKIYINGELNETDALTGTLEFNESIRFGAKATSETYRLNGQIDEIIVWNKTLTATEISSYYLNHTSTANTNYTPITLNLTPFPSLQIYNYWNQSLIKQFEATINGKYFNTKNGILYHNQSGNYLTEIAASGYFNVTDIFDFRGGQSQNTTLYQAELITKAYSYVSGDQIINYSIDLLGTIYQSNTTGQIKILLNSETYNVTIFKENFINQTKEISITPLEQKQINFIIGNSLINITAKKFFGSTIVNEFTTNITRIDGDYNYSNETTTTTGLIQFPLIEGTYSLFIDAPGYATQNINITVNETYQGYEFLLYTTNSISFIFRDEETKELIDNITMELISDYYANNYTTSNGTMYLDLLTPTKYTIRYDSPQDYDERFYYFNLLNRSHTNLTLYLVNNVSATDIIATVYDEGNHLIEDCYIKVLRYDLTTNSYLVQEIVKTNFEGTGILNLILNDEFYKFILEYPLGTVVKETSPTYIYETSIAFQILLGEDVATNFYNSMDISYTDVVFNDNTNNFRWTYSDSNAVVSRACLKVYAIKNLRETFYNSTCVSSSSSTLLIHASEVNGTTYRADAYVTMLGTEYFITSGYHAFKAPSTTGNFGVFMVAILTMFFVFVGYWSKTIALILTPLPLFFGSILGIIDISIGVTLGLEIVCAIIALWISKR